MDDAWVKDVLLPLSIGIVGTAVGSGSLLVLSAFLWKSMMEWCCHSRDQPSPGPTDTPGLVESGDQPLAHHDGGLRDVEMGTLNDGEAAAGHLSNDVGANGSISLGDDGGMRGRNEDMMADGLEILESDLLRKSDSE